jgi:hypothetical protein
MSIKIDKVMEMLESIQNAILFENIEQARTKTKDSILYVINLQNKENKKQAKNHDL